MTWPRCALHSPHRACSRGQPIIVRSAAGDPGVAKPLRLRQGSVVLPTTAGDTTSSSRMPSLTFSFRTCLEHDRTKRPAGCSGQPNSVLFRCPRDAKMATREAKPNTVQTSIEAKPCPKIDWLQPGAAAEESPDCGDDVPSIGRSSPPPPPPRRRRRRRRLPAGWPPSPFLAGAAASRSRATSPLFFGWRCLRRLWPPSPPP